jgi:hypothetical protein
MSIFITPPCFRILTRLSFILLSLFFADPVQADDTRTEFWPEVDVYYKLNQKSRLYFSYSATKLDDRQSYADGSLAGYLDFYTLPLVGRRQHPSADESRSKTLMIRAGYYFVRTPSGSPNPSTEQTPSFEAHTRVPLPYLLLLTDRNRLDFRFIDGDYQPRYRNRLKLERTFKAGRMEVNPYASAEAFYDWKYDKFRRFRYCAGSELALGRHFIFESYYVWQEDTVSSPPHVNAVGMALQFYFP